MLQRIHRGVRTDRIRQTTQGGLAIDAVLSRVGEFEYTDQHGNPRLESRPPEEVLAPESIATLRNATVTVAHPADSAVHTKNWRVVAVGHVGEDVRVEGDAVVGTVYVNDEATIDQILSEKLVEISPGYKVDLDETSGGFVQRNIRYNHVALLPVGEARQGSDVRLRLDAAGNCVFTSQAAAVESTETRKDSTMDEEKIQEMLAAFEEAMMAKVAEKLAAMTEQVQSAADEPAEAEPGEVLDEKDMEELDAKKADEEEALQKRVDAAVSARLDAAKLHERVSGDWPDAKATTAEILESALAKTGFRSDSKFDPDFARGYLAAYLAKERPSSFKAAPERADAASKRTADRIAFDNLQKNFRGQADARK